MNLPDRTTFVISASIFMSPRARNNCRVITPIHVTELAASRTRETDHGGVSVVSPVNYDHHKYISLI